MTLKDTIHEATPANGSAPKPAASNWFAAYGLVAGLGAVVASSCCVIPLGLAALGVSASILGGLEEIAAWRVPLLVISALAIVGGWGAWCWKRSIACVSSSACASAQRSHATLGLLLCASLIVVLAANWTYIDPVLLKMFRGR